MWSDSRLRSRGCHGRPRRLRDFDSHLRLAPRGRQVWLLWLQLVLGCDSPSLRIAHLALRLSSTWRLHFRPPIPLPEQTPSNCSYTYLRTRFSPSDASPSTPLNSTHLCSHFPSKNTDSTSRKHERQVMLTMRARKDFCVHSSSTIELTPSHVPSHRHSPPLNGPLLQHQETADAYTRGAPPVTCRRGYVGR
jgi:hypothetical protein